MAAKLTQEMIDDLEANPHQAVPVVNEQSGKTFFLVDTEFLFDDLENDAATKARLQELIKEGEESGYVSEAKGRARMQATIDKYRNHTA